MSPQSKTGSAQDGDRSPKFSVPGGAWKTKSCQLSFGSQLATGGFGTKTAGAAALIPSHASAPDLTAALPPALARGTGPRQVRQATGPSFWPHEAHRSLSEVSLQYPKKPKRYLIPLGSEAMDKVSGQERQPLPTSNSPCRLVSNRCDADIKPLTCTSPYTPPVRVIAHNVNPCGPQKKIQGFPLAGKHHAVSSDQSIREEDADTESWELYGTACGSVPSVRTSCQQGSTEQDNGSADKSFADSDLLPEPGTSFMSAASVVHSDGARSLELSSVTMPSDLPDAFIRSASFYSRPRRIPPVSPEVKCKVKAAAGVGKLQTETKQKSVQLQETLFCLRRASTDIPAPPEPKPPVRGQARVFLSIKADDEDFTPLMEATLADLQDTSDSLSEGIKKMINIHNAAALLGGARHPTAVVSQRTLQVMQRKRAVLEKLIKQTDAFLEKSNQRRGILDAVVRGLDPQEAGGDAMGFRSRIKASVHLGDIMPDRVDFQHFVETFRLPGQHQAVLRAREALQKEVEPWAEAVLTRAKHEFEKEFDHKGTEPTSHAADAVRRMHVLAAGLGVPQDHRHMRQVDSIGEAAHGAALLRNAKGEAKADLKLAALKEKGDAANAAAERIEANLHDAVALGINDRQPDFLAAQDIAYDLRAEGVRRFALEQVRIKGEAPGDAAAAADRIDQAILAAFQVHKVPSEHRHLVAARKISHEARSEEGMKKRMANMQKQKQKQNAQQGA